MILRANVPFRLSRGALVALLLLTATSVPAWSQRVSGFPEPPAVETKPKNHVEYLEAIELLVEDAVPTRVQAMGIRFPGSGVPTEARQAVERFEQMEASVRQEAQRRRGAAFDLGKYHEEVLGHGTLPVKYLPELVK